MSRVGGHRRGVQLAGILPYGDVLDAEAVKRVDDLERVEAPGVQPGILVFFRGRGLAQDGLQPGVSQQTSARGRLFIETLTYTIVSPPVARVD